MPRASAPAASAKIGTVTATADANASVICMPITLLRAGQASQSREAQTWVAAARFSRAVWVSG